MNVELTREEIVTLLAAMEDLHRDDEGVRFHNGVQCLSHADACELADRLHACVPSPLPSSADTKPQVSRFDANRDAWL